MLHKLNEWMNWREGFGCCAVLEGLQVRFLYQQELISRLEIGFLQEKNLVCAGAEQIVHVKAGGKNEGKSHNITHITEDPGSFRDPAKKTNLICEIFVQDFKVLLF